MSMTGPIVDELFPRRSGTLLGTTAALLSRLVLPPLAVAVSWPESRGRIRVAGKLFWAFYAAACLFWLVASLAPCLLLKAAVPWLARRLAMLPMDRVFEPK